ncbi:MAG: PAS domain-containing protein [Chloroflexi bacterium]|nr:PAS domain-containing protein [Chloroflexota bacterium]
MLQYTPFTVPMLAAALLNTGLVIAALGRPNTRGVQAFILMTGGVTFWSFCYLFHLTATDLSAQVFWANMQLIGITLAPVGWLLLALVYTGRIERIPPTVLLLLGFDPIFAVVMAFTNPLHGLFRTAISQRSFGSYTIMDAVLGPAFWVHTAIAYLLLLSGAVLLIQDLLRRPSAYRGQILSLLAALSAPWAANILFLLSSGPLSSFDTTPIAFTISGAALAYGLFRYRLLELMPVARAAVLDSMVDAVIVVDPADRVVDLNPAAAALVEGDDVTGKHLSTLTLSGEQPFKKLELTQTDQATAVGPHTYAISASPIYSRQGNTPVGRAIILRDISQQRALTETLREQNELLRQANADLKLARAEAEEASRLKNEFLATMSHELRTPLNAIMGFSQLKLMNIGGDLSDKHRFYEERTMENARHLLRLIDDILDIAKIEAGRLEILEGPIDVHDWFSEAIVEASEAAEAKGLRLVTELDETLPDIIIGDAERLRQIADNLLSNAVKFTDEGEIHFSLRRASDNQWEMVVRDTGVGIPSHAQEFIFDSFRQVDGTIQREHGGTGLGLNIVRSLVMLMRGTIRVNSKIDEGSTFTVTLPLLTTDEKVIGD